ncbi:hypothetical protein GCM10027051_18870 [Niabella terrae]
MQKWMKFLVAGSLLLPLLTVAGRQPKPRVLVMCKTAGFYHSSIPAGLAALQKMGKENGFITDTTRDAGLFTEKNLKKYAAVIFLSTTGTILNPDQKAAFEKYIENGGGFVGIHAATDTEYEWPWYNRLVGAYFLNHPQQQQARLLVKDHQHPATRHLPEVWERKDEWYNFKDINPDLNILMTIDESSYEGGANGVHHPMAWYHQVGQGRAFYTALGHTDASYVESLFLEHLLGGIRYAMGDTKP